MGILCGQVLAGNKPSAVNAHGRPDTTLSTSSIEAQDQASLYLNAHAAAKGSSPRIQAKPAPLGLQSGLDNMSKGIQLQNSGQQAHFDLRL
jgi:hypothetical protein